MRLRVAIVALAAVVIVGGVAIWASVASSGSSRPALRQDIAAATRTPGTARTSPPARPSALPTGPVIEVSAAPGGVKAKGAVLADAITGQVLWGCSVAVERPMASVTKVMTALLVLQSGNSRMSYACNPDCMPTVQLGDDDKIFKDVGEQISTRNGYASGSSGVTGK